MKCDFISHQILCITTGLVVLIVEGLCGKHCGDNDNDDSEDNDTFLFAVHSNHPGRKARWLMYPILRYLILVNENPVSNGACWHSIR